MITLTFFILFQQDFDGAQSCLEKALTEYYPNRCKLSSGETDPNVSPEERLACARVRY